MKRVELFLFFLTVHFSMFSSVKAFFGWASLSPTCFMLEDGGAISQVSAWTSPVIDVEASPAGGCEPVRVIPDT